MAAMLPGWCANALSGICQTCLCLTCVCVFFQKSFCLTLVDLNPLCKVFEAVKAHVTFGSNKSRFKKSVGRSLIYILGVFLQVFGVFYYVFFRWSSRLVSTWPATPCRFRLISSCRRTFVVVPLAGLERALSAGSAQRTPIKKTM